MAEAPETSDRPTPHSSTPTRTFAFFGQSSEQPPDQSDLLAEIRRLHAEQLESIGQRFTALEAKVEKLAAAGGGGSSDLPPNAPRHASFSAPSGNAARFERPALRHESPPAAENGMNEKPAGGGGESSLKEDLRGAPSGNEIVAAEVAKDRAREQKRAEIKQAKQEQFLNKFAHDEVFGKSKEKYEEDAEAAKKKKRVANNSSTWGSKFMLMPSSGVRLVWDGLSMLLVMFIAITLPYRVAFNIDCPSPEFAVADLVIDVFFIVDLVLNFRTAYVQDGELVADWREVGKKYISFWFWLDLLSSVPFDWFVEGAFEFELLPGCDAATGGLVNNVTVSAGESNKATQQATQTFALIRIFKVVKLLRLLRVARLFRYLRRWEEQFIQFNSSTIRMFKLVITVLVFSHWNGCFQFLIATLNRDTNGPLPVYTRDSWVYRAGISESLPLRQWSWSFFHAASQLLAISVGLVPPGTETEVWIYLSSMLMGATLYAVFVASVTAFFADADPSAKEYRGKLDMVNQYMRHAQLPRTLRIKLRTYYELRFPGGRAFDEDQIFSELSSPLTQEVRVHKCRTVLSALNIIEEDKTLAYELCEHLRRVVFVAGDFIIRQHEASDGMYFVSSGSVEVISDYSGLSTASNEPITTLGAHSFFGEMSLLAPDGKATASVRVITYFEGYLLSYDDYLKIVNNHPSFHQYLQAAAALRLRTRAEVSGADKSADLATLFDMLDPTKRKLIRLEKQQAAERERARESAPWAAPVPAPAHGEKARKMTRCFGGACISIPGSKAANADESPEGRWAVTRQLTRQLTRGNMLSSRGSSSGGNSLKPARADGGLAPSLFDPGASPPAPPSEGGESNQTLNQKRVCIRAAAAPGASKRAADDDDAGAMQC